MRSASSRLRVLHTIFVALLLGLSARAAYLSLWETRADERAKSQIQGHLLLPPERGLILDRHGVELAVTLHAPSVYVIPRQLERIQPTARVLAEILDLDAGTLAERLRERQGFTFVRRWVSREQAEQIQIRALPGVGIAEEPRRAYPAGPLAAALLGFANIDGVGVRAVEQLEDETLRGRMRTVPVERDARKQLMVVERTNPRDAAGGDVRLTIDAALQAQVEAALQAAVQASGSWVASPSWSTRRAATSCPWPKLRASTPTPSARSTSQTPAPAPFWTPSSPAPRSRSFWSRALSRPG